ncbi:MAG: DNA-3-methyladenine glycosylase [Phycisphaerales bacterium]
MIDPGWGERLGRGFYSVGARRLARALIGTTLVRRLPTGETVAGVIVETEAYVGVRDRASHAFGGRRTARNESMYGPPGTAYVYFTYGMHHCFNVVCGLEGEPEAVLVRALEPIAGVETMRRLRMEAGGRAAKGGQPGPARIAERDLCRGPGRLCRAAAIDRSLDGIDLTGDSAVWIVARACSGVEGYRKIERSARVGVAYAGAWADRPLRYLAAGHPCVSVGGRGGGSRRPRK